MSKIIFYAYGVCISEMILHIYIASTYSKINFFLYNVRILKIDKALYIIYIYFYRFTLI